MSGPAITAYLRRLCRDMDLGRPLEPFRWRRALAPLAVPMVMGLSIGAVGCEDAVTGQPTLEHAAPMSMPDRPQPEPLRPDPAQPEPTPASEPEAPPSAPGDGGPTRASDAAQAEAGGPSGAPAPVRGAEAPPSGAPARRRAIEGEMVDLYGAPFE